MIANRGDMRRPVCIVDDDASVREAVGSLLRSAGLTVETFGSAREFLASPRRDAPSCLVLDVELPGQSGLDLQQELIKGNVRVPIIFLTGRGDIPMSVRAIRAGALDFLTKPVDVDQLLGAIETEHRERLPEEAAAAAVQDQPHEHEVRLDEHTLQLAVQAVDQRLHLVVAGRGTGDDIAAVGVAHEHDRAGQAPQEFGHVRRLASQIAKRVGEADGAEWQAL